MLLVACNNQETQTETTTTESQTPAPPLLTVYKSPSCGCCQSWISHLNDKGIHTTAHNMHDLSALKGDHHIHPRYQSCHTAISQDGYVFEGHIPAKYIQQFLQEKPDGAIGLAVPAMPVGSPGMEVGDHFSPYTILLLMKDGSHQIYAKVTSRKEQY